MRRIIYFVTEDWYFLSHRLPAARTAASMGFEVHVITRDNGNAAQFEREGFVLHPISVDRTGTNLFGDYALLRTLVKLFREINPCLVHNVALKPIIYGSEAARYAFKPPVVNAFAGLGFVFSSSSRKAQALRPLVSAALHRANSAPTTTALFQNSDDMDRLVRSKIIRENQAQVIAGSGVDVAVFDVQPICPEEKMVVGLPARLLREKGVLDFVQAAREVRSRNSNIRMALVGEPDPMNPTSVAMQQIQEWEKAGLIEYWGWSDNMAETLKDINVVCLPSTYGEGLPKSLLEASSAGLPVITTDAPGCRDALIPGVTGIRVPPSSPTYLAQAIQVLASSPELRLSMGMAGREFVVQNFSNQVVSAKLRDLYSQILSLS